MNPIEILNQRLANGEISVDEHQQILHLLAAVESQPSQPPQGRDGSIPVSSVAAGGPTWKMVIEVMADYTVLLSIIAALLWVVTIGPKHFPGVNLRQPLTIAVNIIVLSAIVVSLGNRMRTALSKIRRAHKLKSKLLIAANYGSTGLTIGLMTVLCVVVIFFLLNFPSGSHS